MHKKKNKQRDRCASCSASYVHCFMARDEPHVSVGGLLAWERSTRKNFTRKQKKVHHARDRKKGRLRRKKRTSAGRMEMHAMKERRVHGHAGDSDWKKKGVHHGH